MWSEQDEQNRHRCERVADRLKSILDGEARVTSDGEVFFPKDGETYDGDDVEVATLYDYFHSEDFDVEYKIDGNLNYCYVSIMVAGGGPSIFVNTQTRDIELTWSGDKARYPMDDAVVDAIDTLYEREFKELAHYKYGKY